MHEDEINELMGCECDYDVRPIDVYFKDHKIVAIFICTGCGRKVMVEGPIESIYDITVTRHKRED